MKMATIFSHEIRLTESISSRVVNVEPFGDETHRYEHYRIADGGLSERPPIVSYDGGLTFQVLHSSDTFEVLLNGCRVSVLPPQELQALAHTEYLAAPVRL